MIISKKQRNHLIQGGHLRSMVSWSSPSKLRISTCASLVEHIYSFHIFRWPNDSNSSEVHNVTGEILLSTAGNQPYRSLMQNRHS